MTLDLFEGLTSCDFCGDGCCEPACKQCYPAPPRFTRPVVCAWCGNRYRDVIGTEPGESYTQGDGCATVVGQRPDGTWYAEGFYGSTSYDTDRFTFVQNPPTEKGNPVCDNCIGERISVGDLERVGRGEP